MLLFAWLFISCIVGVLGNLRGRWGIGWALLAMIISPLFAGVILFMLPRIAPPSVVNEAPVGNIQAFQPAQATAQAAQTVASGSWVWWSIFVVAMILLYAFLSRS
jgi:hypothetical protein